jgi:uncharacterized protein (TIGR03118 family)
MSPAAGTGKDRMSASAPMRIGSVPAMLALSAADLSGCLEYDQGRDEGYSFRQVNLVADTLALPSKFKDTTLSNPWGIAAGPGGTIWVSGNLSGKTILYDTEGNTVGPSVAIPSAKRAKGGAPTGVVYNGTSGFRMPDGSGRALFIFAGEDGSLSAWNSGASATLVADRSDSGAAYTGLTLAPDGGAVFLYVADFRGRRVDVFNALFLRDTTRSFRDTTLPEGYSPHNVVRIGTELFVAYARVKDPDVEKPAPAGEGYVNVFGTDGAFLRRFVSDKRLDDPWAIVSVPGVFGPFEEGIFIGNSGDGRIHVYDSKGFFLGQVQNNRDQAIKVEGLWALHPVVSGRSQGEPGRMYFTAGPSGQALGLFGYLTPQ